MHFLYFDTNIYDAYVEKGEVTHRFLNWVKILFINTLFIKQPKFIDPEGMKVRSYKKTCKYNVIINAVVAISILQFSKKVT